MLLEDDDNSGQSFTNKTPENLRKINELFHKDHHQTIHELCHIVGIDYRTCQEIILLLCTYKAQSLLFHLLKQLISASFHWPSTFRHIFWTHVWYS